MHGGHNAPGVTVRHAPDHTPGYYVLVVSSGIDRAIPPGDTVACPLQLTETDIAGSEDGDEWT